MKKIGISFTKTNFQNYWNWFGAKDLAGNVDLVELSFVRNNVEDINSCDGFILSGGVDIDPVYYKGSPEYAGMPEEFQQDRDRFEAQIYRFSQSNKIPLLGVCRGLQFVNVMEGGALIQDLGTGNDIHKKTTVDKVHGVMVQPDTLLADITAASLGVVNSAHHQAIDPQRLGKNLRVNAVSTDGEPVIEGIEFKDKHDKGFMLCIQWHPERMLHKEENKFSINLKNRFLQEVNR